MNKLKIRSRITLPLELFFKKDSYSITYPRTL